MNCHDYGKQGASKLLLARDRESCFNASYRELWQKKYLSAIGAGPAEIMQARSWGSNVSRLVKTLDAGHHGVRLSPQEYERIITWIDINAPYYPTYATNFPQHFAGRNAIDQGKVKRLAELVGHKDIHLPPTVSYDRPELSPCLQGLAKDSPEYQEALSIIEEGRKTLLVNPGADSPNFVPCEIDQWRQVKYVLRADLELQRREAIQKGSRVADQPTSSPAPPTAK